MLTLSDIVWFAVAALVLNHFWRGRDFKARALAYAQQHCIRLGVQLLDQSVVLKKIRVRRDSRGMLVLQRCYEFEFTTSGERRYRGELLMLGRQLMSLDVEPHIMPDTDG